MCQVAGEKMGESDCQRHQQTYHCCMYDRRMLICWCCMFVPRVAACCVYQGVRTCIAQVRIHHWPPELTSMQLVHDLGCAFGRLGPGTAFR
jgi:hypothetical protein